MPQTGIVMATPGVGVLPAWGGMDFARLPDGTLVVAAVHPPSAYHGSGSVTTDGRLRVHRYDTADPPEPSSYVEVEAGNVPACALVTSAGRLHLFYSLWTGATLSLRYRRSDDGGATWSEAEAISHTGVLLRQGLAFSLTQSVVARITRDGLCVLLYQDADWTAPSAIRPALFVGSMGADGFFDFLAPQRLATGAPRRSNDLQAGAVGGRLNMLPHYNKLTNIEAGGGFVLTERSTSSPSPASITLGAGLVDELTNSWLQMGSFRGDALYSESDRIIWVWSNILIPDSNGGSIGAWSAGVAGAHPTETNHIRGYWHSSAGVESGTRNARLQRRRDGRVEFLYARYPDGNLVFARCRALTNSSVVMPTWDIG